MLSCIRYPCCSPKREARQQKQPGQLSWLYPLFKLSSHKEARQQKQQGQHATWHSLSLLSLLSSKLFSLPLIRLAGRQADVLARRLAVVQTGVEFDHPGAAPSRVGAAAFHLVVVAAAHPLRQAGRRASAAHQCEVDNGGGDGQQRRVEAVQQTAVSGQQVAAVLDAERAFHLALYKVAIGTRHAYR